ncbi:hypothetical protein LT493_31875 [Streptomyces tricolor]|nr:hypothetical protein [Streptomyces tricolor]
MPAAASPLTAAYDRLGAAGFPGADRDRSLGPGGAAARRRRAGRPRGLAAGGAELDAFLAWDAGPGGAGLGRPAGPDVVASFVLHRPLRLAPPAC